MKQSKKKGESNQKQKRKKKTLEDAITEIKSQELEISGFKLRR